jgi:hypothetical protein
MIADVETFRALFPELGAAADQTVLVWIEQSAVLDATRIGPVNYPLAQLLFAAHNVALGLQAAKAGTPGASFAPVTSKGADGLSVSFDVNLTAIDGAGVYNATSYGQRLWKLLEAAAMGGMYRAPPARRHVFGYGRGYGRGIF